MSEHKIGCPSPYDYCTCGAPGSVKAREQLEKQLEEMGSALHNVGALQFKTAGENLELSRKNNALRQLLAETVSMLEIHQSSANIGQNGYGCPECQGEDLHRGEFKHYPGCSYEDLIARAKEALK